MSTREFVQVGESLIPVANIYFVDLGQLENGSVTVHFHLLTYRDSQVSSNKQQALDIVMQLHPAALEGKRLKWARQAWAFHNLLAHPGLQVLAWLKRTTLGFKLHDATIPGPRP